MNTKYFILVIFMCHFKVAFGQPFLSNIDSPTTCLALNIFFEARGESMEGRLAVGMVTLNRYNKNLSKSICDIVFEPSFLPIRKPLACQFSWTCDTDINHRLELREDERAYIEIYLLAREILNGDYHYDITLGSDHYYNCELIPLPDSFYGLHFTKKIGKHCFYSSTNTNARH